MAKQVITPDDLGSEFDLGTIESNKVRIKTDGNTIITNASGELEVNTNSLGIPTIPNSYNDEQILTSGLPTPLNAATNQEEVNIQVANLISNITSSKSFTSLGIVSLPTTFEGMNITDDVDINNIKTYQWASNVDGSGNGGYILTNAPQVCQYTDELIDFNSSANNIDGFDFSNPEIKSTRTGITTNWSSWVANNPLNLSNLVNGVIDNQSLSATATDANEDISFGVKLNKQVVVSKVAIRKPLDAPFGVGSNSNAFFVAGTKLYLSDDGITWAQPPQTSTLSDLDTDGEIILTTPTSATYVGLIINATSGTADISIGELQIFRNLEAQCGL